MSTTIDDLIKTGYTTGKHAKISVSFNKLIRTKDYESERIQADLELDVNPEEDILLEIAKAQSILEYSCMTQLLYKNQISQAEFNIRKEELNSALATIELKLDMMKHPEKYTK